MTLSLDKNDWFVDPGDSTDGNRVAYLIDGVQAFAEIDVYLSGLKKGDFCYFAAWRLTPGFKLGENASESILDKFVSAADAEADVRILTFQNWGDAWDEHKELKEQLELQPLHPVQLLMDRKHQSFGSQHQKFCVFGNYRAATDTYDLTAFCGGIDPAVMRLDDENHRGPSVGSHMGWHDVHAKVEGPAAQQLLETFTERWNDHEHPLAASKYNTVTTSIDRVNVQLPVLPGNTHQVEVLHTYSCGGEQNSGWGYIFAGDGIRSIRDAYLKAIDQAQHYIYIENQYFSDMEDVVSALLDKLGNSQVKVFVVTPYLMGFGYDNLRLDAWMRFKRSQNFSNFYLCDLRHPGAGYRSVNVTYRDSNYKKPIYVHAKIMIVDDVYALIGSANMNVRSMENDSELAVAVLDSETEVDGGLGVPVCKFARDFRIALWQEHLYGNRSSGGSIPRDITESLPVFIDSINDPASGIDKTPSRIFKHDPSNIWYSPANRALIGNAEKRPSCQR